MSSIAKIILYYRYFSSKLSYSIAGTRLPQYLCPGDYSLTQGLREGGSGGTSYPGPGLGGPEEWRLSQQVLNKIFFSALPFFCPCYLGKKSDQIWVKIFFFCSSPNFGQKIGPNLSKDLSFFFLLFT